MGYHYHSLCAYRVFCCEIVLAASVSPKILSLILDALSGGKYQLRCLHNAQDALLGHQQGFPVVGGRQVPEVSAQSLIREMDFRIGVDSSAIMIK